jgi:hypothetical protein
VPLSFKKKEKWLVGAGKSVITVFAEWDQL